MHGPMSQIPKLRSTSPTRLCYVVATTVASLVVLVYVNIDWSTTGHLFRDAPTIVAECRSIHAHTNLSNWQRSRPVVVEIMKCLRALSVR